MKVEPPTIQLAAASAIAVGTACNASIRSPCPAVIDITQATASSTVATDHHIAVSPAAEPPNPSAPEVPPRPISAPTTTSSVPAAARRRGCDLDCSEATKRKCKMAEIYFLDYYFDLLTYLDQRKQRTEEVKNQIQNSKLSDVNKVQAWKTHLASERNHLRQRRTRLRLSSFDILVQVGQGGYGQVFLARKRDSKEICALKKMSKKLLHRMGEVHHILTERDVLTRTDTPWLVKLLYAFQDIEHVYLAMEYVPGGDMRTLLNNSGVLREEHARFYVAEMFTAVGELHRLGYIHRDLKPENFLIDETGHLKLTDFGLSRGSVSDDLMDSLKSRLEKVKDTRYIYRSTRERRDLYQTVRRDEMRGYSQVGSPDYMAPEVLLIQNGRGYNLAVDYWSIGCILFECLAGFPPFTAPTSDDVWVNVYHWQKVLERPVYSGEDEEFNFTDGAWDLVVRLINHADRRLSKLADVQLHPFFAMYPFTALRASNGPVPPFVPQLRNPTDTSYFDDFSSAKDMAMYQEVRDRAAMIEAKAHEAEVEERMGGGGGGARKGAAVGVDGGGGVAGLRTAFVGFTFKHKESRQFQ